MIVWDFDLLIYFSNNVNSISLEKGLRSSECLMRSLYVHLSLNICLRVNWTCLDAKKIVTFILFVINFHNHFYRTYREPSLVTHGWTHLRGMLLLGVFLLHILSVTLMLGIVRYVWLWSPSFCEVFPTCEASRMNDSVW